MATSNEPNAPVPSKADILDFLNIQKIGLFTFILIVMGCSTGMYYLFSSFIPYVTRSEFTNQIDALQSNISNKIDSTQQTNAAFIKDQTSLNQGVLDQLKALNGRVDGDEAAQQDLADDVIQMQQREADKAGVPYVPRVPRHGRGQ
jgi:hypothetical protein